MNKFLIFVGLFMGVAFSNMAQQSNTLPQFSIGGEFGQPTGGASNVYGTVLGASAKLEIPVVQPGLSITATVGLSAYILRFYYSGPFSNTIYVPLELGGKYYFSKIAYVEGDFGASFNSSNNNYSTAQTAFIYAPVIGVSAPTNHHRNTIDLSLRYESRVEGTGTVSQFAIRLAYRLKIK